MQVNRYIAWLLLMCFSAFLGHNLVPHHHHSEAYLNPIATDCPVQHNDHHDSDQEGDAKDHHSDQHPTHCHAFNDVAFEKQQAKVLTPKIGQTRIAIASAPDQVPDTRLTQVFYKYDRQKFPLRIIELYGSRNLRGPPQMA